MYNLMTIKDLAKELKVSESTVRTWKRRGDIPSNCFHKIGTKVFLKIDSFKNWIENNS